MTGAALLLAGQTSVTVQLQSIDSSVSFEPTDMIVGQWPIRVGTVFVKVGNPVQPGVPIIELTEPSLSVQLQASASTRANLAVGQSCTIQVSGSETQVQGTITELDATPTNVSAGGQSNLVYEGRVDSPDLAQLGGTDGATVSITAVDQQATLVPTVPIAAVKQNGTGADVVRLIGRSGHITEVRVTTGLSSGSYIQIKRGLRIGQTVVVQSSTIVVTTSLVDTGEFPTVTPVMPLPRTRPGLTRLRRRRAGYALREVSLRIMPGEFMSIVGPSGSGKSTMLGLLGVPTFPTSGAVMVAGRDMAAVDDPTRSKLRGDSIGFVFQQFHLVPHLTALGNVETALLYRGIKPKDRRERAFEALSELGLAERADHRPVQLSGGSSSGWRWPGPS